jgi:membrane protein DedA with SNARE-associated domain
MSPVRTVTFVLLNAVGAMVWAIAVGVSGYFFGNALEALIGDIKHYELQAFVAIAIIGALIWFIHLRRRRKVSVSPSKPSQKS